MKTNYIIFIFSLLYSSSIYAQTFPQIQIEGNEVIDVLIYENTIYWATKNGLIKLDNEDNKTILYNNFEKTNQGYLQTRDNGWIFIGWEYQSLDVILPLVRVQEYQGDSVINHSIDLLDLNIGSIESASYQSNDSIYLLMEKWGEYSLVTVNTNSEVINSTILNIDRLEQILLIKPNVNLIIGNESVYIFENNEVKKQIKFDSEIIDVQFYNNDRIEVLTENKMHWLNEELQIIKTISLPDNNRTPVNFSIKDNLFSLIETQDDFTYIVLMDTLGNYIGEYKEIQYVKYQGIHIYEDKFALWGYNNCQTSRNILKLDGKKLDFPIPTQDLSLDYIDVSEEFVVWDTVILGNGNIQINKKSIFNWEIQITNLDSVPVQGYEVNSRHFYYTNPPFIDFVENDILLSGESKIHTGSFSFNGIPSNLQNNEYFFFIWVGSNIVDRDCSNNRTYNLFTTKTKDLNLNKLVKVYPNPATDFIQVQLPNPIENTSWILKDFSGKTILNGTVSSPTSEFSIDIQSIPNGIYFIELYHQNRKMYSSSIVKM